MVAAAGGAGAAAVHFDSVELAGAEAKSLAVWNGFMDTRRGELCGWADVVAWSRSFGTEMCLWTE